MSTICYEYILSSMGSLSHVKFLNLNLYDCFKKEDIMSLESLLTTFTLKNKVQLEELKLDLRNYS